MIWFSRLVLGAVLVLLLVVPAGSGQMYGWRDAQGTLHLTDDLTKVPASHRDKAQVFSLPESTAPAPSVERSTGAEEESGEEEAEEEAETEEGPADPFADCRAELRAEVARWQGRLAEDAKRKEQITREIHRTTTARKKNDLQAERSELNRRIEEARQMLETGLRNQARECRMDPDW
ncbi:MAG: DUF4124 domain-containing protein [bacterium]